MSKNINPDVFNKFPLIQDSIASNLNKNVFLVKGDEVKRSFFSGNLELSYPYFECLIPMNERIDFFLEGKGRAVEVIPGCEQAECSYDPIVFDVPTAFSASVTISSTSQAASRNIIFESLTMYGLHSKKQKLFSLKT